MRQHDGVDVVGGKPQTRERALDALFAPEAPWTLIVVSDLPEVQARCTQVVELPGNGGKGAR